MSFDGDATAGAADVRTLVSLRAKAMLSLHEPPTEAVSGARISLDVRAVAAGLPLDGGIIVVRKADGTSVSSAPVRAGRARVDLRVEDPPGTRAAFELSYKSNTPWVVSGDPLPWRATIQHAAPMSLTLLLAVFSALIALVTLSWRRSRRRPRPQLALEPGIFVVASEPNPSEPRRWRGQVLDAHDGTALARVSIQLRRPAVHEEDAVLVATQSDAEGAFVLEPRTEPPEGCRIEVSHTTHSSARRRLPPPGVLRICLSTRRRTVIARFVSWAKRRMPAHAAPTPAQAAARHADNAAIASWAGQVQDAMFGPDATDAEREYALREAEPGASDQDHFDGPSSRH
jgi:hypothetical protein